MKTLQTLLLLGMTIGVTLLFSRCSQGDWSDQEIPYNRENAKQHIISIRTAAEFTSNFKRGKRELSRQLKDTTYLNNRFDMPYGEKFNRDAIAALLNQRGAKGVRIYLGQDKKGMIRMVLVAVNERGTDITGTNDKVAKFASNTSTAFALEAGQRCPTLCSLSTPLN